MYNMEGLEDELTCPVCLELYTCPLLLPCHHNLCRRCAEAFLETHPEEPAGAQAACSSEPAPPSPEGKLESFACPTCRTEVRLGDPGVDGLRKNLLLQNIIDRFKHAQSQWKRDAVECLVCDATPPREAVKSCTNCKLSYCRDCLTLMHPARGVLANHQLVPPIESFDALQKAVMCPDHKNKPVELYCKKDKTPVCSLCKLVGKHKEHDVAALEEVCGTKQEDLQKVVEELAGKIEEEKIKIIALKITKRTMESHETQVKLQIKTDCAALINIIRQREVAMVANVHEVLREDTGKIKTLIESSQEKVKSANSCLAYAKEAAKETDPACFLQTEQLVTGRVKQSTHMFVHDEQYTRIPTDRVTVDLSPVKSLLEGLDLPHVPVISPEKCKATAHEATVLWDTGDGQDYKFDVLCSSAGENPVRMRNVQGNSCEVKGLQESKGYSVTVISKTDSGTAKSDSFPMETTSESVIKEGADAKEDGTASYVKSFHQAPLQGTFSSTKTVVSKYPPPPVYHPRSRARREKKVQKKREAQPAEPSTQPAGQPKPYPMFARSYTRAFPNPFAYETVVPTNEEKSCPECNKVFPDLNALQTHFMECL